MSARLNKHSQISDLDMFSVCRIKKSSPKIESSLSEMISEGFTKIQSESAERVREKLNQFNR